MDNEAFGNETDIVGESGFECVREGEVPAEPLGHRGSPGGSPSRIACQNEFANSIRNAPNLRQSKIKNTVSAQKCWERSCRLGRVFLDQLAKYNRLALFEAVGLPQ